MAVILTLLLFWVWGHVNSTVDASDLEERTVSVCRAELLNVYSDLGYVLLMIYTFNVIIDLFMNSLMAVFQMYRLSKVE